ncbi:hypothetical protein BH18ACI1_BH18ACI1_15350 [soil metagenome]
MKLPEKITKLAELIKQNGGRAMLVGGSVRDELMGVEPKDWDVEIYGIEPSKLKEILDLFGKVNAVGEAFTVYKIDNDLDVSLPRRERKVSRGHKGFIVEGDKDMSFEEAAKRRDFTINAILKDVLTGEIVDIYGGRADIERKLIRHVSSETFAEDSLRVLRAAQFAARFEFDIASETIEICRQIDVTDLPKERIWGEFEKLLLKARKPSIGLQWLYDLGVVKQIFPELEALVGVPQDEQWHPEGELLTHSLLVIDRAREQIDDLPYAKKVAVMLGALCHDFGKPATTEFFDGRWRSHAHDEAGVEPTISFLNTLGIYTLDGYDVREQVIQLVRYHLKPGEFYRQRENLGDGAFRRLARRVKPDLLYRVAKADNLGRNAEWIPPEKWFTSEAQDWFIEKARKLEVENEAPKPFLMGRHLIELGLKPSAQFGEIIKAVYEMQLDGQITNLEEAVNQAKILINISDKIQADKPTNETETPAKSSSGSIKILLACLVAGTEIVYYFSNPRPLIYYDYTFRIAENILHGRIGLAITPLSWLNELIPLAGFYYSAFPLGSMLTMLPFAALKAVGIVSDMPSALIAALTASGVYLFLLLIAGQYEYAWSKRILLTTAILFGTWMWTNLAFGGAWQLALGFAMLGELGAIYFTVFNRKPLLAGFFFALAFGNRTEILLTAPIFMYLMWKEFDFGFQISPSNSNFDSVNKHNEAKSIQNPKSKIQNQIWFCLAPFLLGVSTLIYNYVRFASPFDFGYARIPGVLNEPWYNHGIFSIFYIPNQAYEMLFKLWEVKSVFPYLVPNGFSNSILLSSPFLFLLLRFGKKDKILKYAAWAAIAIQTFLLWTHGNSGGLQFGYRYAMILLPWVFIILLENSPKKITFLEWFLYLFSFIANIYATYLFFYTDYVKL